VTFKATSKDKILVRGDTLTLRFRIRAKQLNPDDAIVYLDLTGTKLRFTMKLTKPTGLDFRDIPPAVSKTQDDTTEIEIEDQLDDDLQGRFKVFLVATDTRFLPPGVYAYDTQGTTAQGSVFTVPKGGGRILLRSRPTEAEDLT
jgi:hypothetical protein